MKQSYTSLAFAAFGFFLYVTIFSFAADFATDRSNYLNHFSNPESSRFEPIFRYYMNLLKNLGIHPYFSFSITSMFIASFSYLSIKNFQSRKPILDGLVFLILLCGVLAYYSGIAFRNGLAIALVLYSITNIERYGRKGWFLLFIAPLIHYSTTYVVLVYLFHKIIYFFGVKRPFIVLFFSSFIAILLVLFSSAVVDHIFPSWVFRAVYEREVNSFTGHLLFFSFSSILYFVLFIIWMVRFIKVPYHFWSIYDYLFIYSFPVVSLHFSGNMSFRVVMPFLALYFLFVTLCCSHKFWPKSIRDAALVCLYLSSIVYFINRLNYF